MLPQIEFFDGSNFDLRPLADPSSVTRMQKIAKAQFLLQTGQNNPVVNQRELMMRVYEAADIEDIDKLLPEPDPNAPPPIPEQKLASEAELNTSRAQLFQAQTAKIGADVGHMLGAAGEPSETLGSAPVKPPVAGIQ